jgi:hypothetical protein
MTQEQKVEQALGLAGKTVLRTAISQSAKHVTTAATGNPLVGRVAGHAAGAAYDHIPDPVKGGAAVGGLLAVHAGTHIMSVGTAGSIAAGTAVLAFAPWLIIGGAAVGGLLWLFSD